MTAPARTHPALLTEERAAAYLLISPRTLRDLRQRGAIRYVRLTARKVAYRPEDLDDYVAAHVRLATPQPEPAPQPKGKARRAGTGNVVPFSQRSRS